jgi:hypothetical protein
VCGRARERADARLLGDPRDRERIAMPGSARADLERDRHVDRAHDGSDDRRDERLVRQKRGARGRVADFLAGQPMLMSMICAPRSTLYRAASAITADRRRRSARRSVHFAAMVGAPLRFLRAPQAGIRRDHLRHRVPAPSRLHNWRKGRSVTPAIGATTRLLPMA